jgi:hypothetical protein
MKKILLVALLPPLAIGCASKNIEYPRATMYPNSTQQKMQAAAHWNALAENEAKLIAQLLPSDSVVHITSHISCESGECDDENKKKSPFRTAYKDLLTTQLFRKGVKVALESEPNTYDLSYNVQVVKHKDRAGLPVTPGSLTGSTVTAFGIYKASASWDPAALVALPLAVAGDMYLYNRTETVSSNSEVLVTTKISKGNRVIVSDSHIYYFNAGDKKHYEDKVNGMVVTDTK